MQPGANPDDLRTILSRFHTWAEKEPSNGNGHGKGAAPDGVRELTYEEALERHRARAGAPRARKARAAATQEGVARENPGKAAKEPDFAAQGMEAGGGEPTPDATEMATQGGMRTRPRTDWVERAEYPGRGETEILLASASPQEELPFAVGDGPGMKKPVGGVADPTAAPAAARALDRLADPVAERVLAKRGERIADGIRTQGAAQGDTAPAGGKISAKAGSAAKALGADRKSASRAGRQKMEQPEFRQVLAETVRAVKGTQGKAAQGKGGVVKAGASKAAPAEAAVLNSGALKADAPVKTQAVSAPKAAQEKKTLVGAKRPSRAGARKAGGRRRLEGVAAAAPGKAVRHSAGKAARKTAAAVQGKREPDRTRRITTRFSAAEERRIEKAAAAAGLNVSAWLRQCALAAEEGRARRGNARSDEGEARPTRPKAARPRAAASAPPPAPASLFTQPANSSLVGGWLSLLRQRFLGAPVRFAERA